MIIRTHGAVIAVAVLMVAVAATAEEKAGNASVGAVVDFAKPIGRIRPIHGVNNGPAVWSGEENGLTATLTKRHKEAGFPSVRLHDCHWPAPDVVDVPCIFPISDADPDDPRYYCFAKTDAYLAPIVSNCEKITYRLGTSIEHWTNFHTSPPKDFAKWAKVCVNIIRHYNEGWANGFHYNIKHWEIWNEPETGRLMWTGTLQQYFELYEIVARAIKAHDPWLNVGGPSACQMNGYPSVLPFLVFCRDRKVPLDFVSWHSYRNSPSEVIHDAAAIRAMLDRSGFKDIRQRITEWNRLPEGAAKETEQQKLDTMRGPKAAAFAASTLMLLQDHPIDMANFYTADTNPWGMFDSFGVPGKVYYAFLAFNQLTKAPNRLECVIQDSPQQAIVVCAGLSDDRKNGSILMSNFGAIPCHVSISLRNLPPQLIQSETFAVDAKHEFTPIAKTSVAPAQGALAVDLPDNAVYLIRLSSAK
jgi:hypothetical protein